MKKNTSILISSILMCCSLSAKTPNTPAPMQTNPSQDKECICSAKSLSRAFTSVANKAIPAVVYIKVEGYKPQSPYGQHPFDSFQDDLFNHFFGQSPRQRQPAPPPVQNSQGSGFLISSDGYILTNFHVVQDASKITVVLQDGYNYEVEATLIGGDRSTDIAMIKIEGQNYPYLTFGDSENIEVGEWCVAVGNPFQLEATVTVGVISAKGRQNLQITELENFIQTDAAINPGNSGGPLLNLDGEVIGMNTAIVSRSGGYMGIGFAIPSNIIENIKTQLISNGKVNPGFLGVQLQPIDKDLASTFNLAKPEGALVAEVVKGSPADKAGIQQGDIILEINGTPLKSAAAIRREIMLMQPNQTAKLKVRRADKIMEFNVTLGSHPSKSNDQSLITEKLGLDLEELTPEKAQQLGYPADQSGVLISNVRPNSPGRNRIRPGSILVAVNHQTVSSLDAVNKAMNQKTNNDKVLLLIREPGGHMRFVGLTPNKTK